MEGNGSQNMQHYVWRQYVKIIKQYKKENTKKKNFGQWLIRSTLTLETQMSVSNLLRIL